MANITRYTSVDLPDMTFEYYGIESDVRPSPGYSGRTDVMLIQFLLAQYFAAVSRTYTCPQAQQFIQMFLCLKSRGKRWDDGIYGNNTRIAVQLFEQAEPGTSEPGIFHRGWAPTIAQGEPGRTKINILNWVFDRAMCSDVSEKRRIIEAVANPVLVSRMRTGWAWIDAR